MSDELGGPTSAQLGAVIDSVQGLSNQVRGLRNQTAEQSEALDTARTIMVIAGIAIFIALAVGALGAFEGWRANDALDRNERERVERAIAACDQTNDFYGKHNAFVHNVIHTFDAFLASSRPETVAYAREQISRYKTNLVELRDCTPDGIERYLSTTTTRGG